MIGYLHQREMRLLQEKEQASTDATRPHKNKLGAKDAVPGAKETPFERCVVIYLLLFLFFPYLFFDLMNVFFMSISFR